MSSPLRPLADTGLEVYPLCLGGNVFGWTADEPTSFDVLDAYVAGGGNFIDTAEVYSAWVPGNSGGESETVIGNWLAARGNRDQVVVATKVGYAATADDAPGRLSANNLRKGVEGSLRRLQTDHIDLYYAHQDDPGTDLDETLAGFAQMVDDGLVRAVAASNYTAPRLAEAIARGGTGRATYRVLQPHYNLAERGLFEGPLDDLCRQEGMAVLPYFSLARGFLTGKYRRDQLMPTSPRSTGVAASFMNDRGFGIIDALDTVADRTNATPAQVSLAWLMQRPGVVAPIASATSVEQLTELMGAADVSLNPEDVSLLDTASA
jgi:aryl-alcohol dehydrogenase-like predicted oxidoreductase